MNKIYHLTTCDTCRRILKEINTDGIELQEIKTQPITVAQIEEMHQYTKSYEALFSKRAKKYKEMGLKDQTLSETDYKQLILETYTFLQRPVAIINGEIFIGNSKKNIEALKNAVNKN